MSVQVRVAHRIPIQPDWKYDIQAGDDSYFYRVTGKHILSTRAVLLDTPRDRAAHVVRGLTGFGPKKVAALIEAAAA